MANSLNDKFREIADQIKNTAVDFTTLEVTTITGSIKQVIDSKGKFKVKEVVSSLNKTGATSAKVDVIAHTHIDFDHDTVNFVKSNLGSQQKKLFELHQTSIDSAHNARRSFLNFLLEVID